MSMKKRHVFYGTFGIVFISAILLMAGLGFDPNRLPEWCAYPLYPGCLLGFLCWWVYGIGPKVAILWGASADGLLYAAVALCAYHLWHWVAVRPGRRSGRVGAKPPLPVLARLARLAGAVRRALPEWVADLYAVVAFCGYHVWRWVERGRWVAEYASTRAGREEDMGVSERVAAKPPHRLLVPFAHLAAVLRRKLPGWMASLYAVVALGSYHVWQWADRARRVAEQAGTRSARADGMGSEDCVAAGEPPHLLVPFAHLTAALRRKLPGWGANLYAAAAFCGHHVWQWLGRERWTAEHARPRSSGGEGMAPEERAHAWLVLPFVVPFTHLSATLRRKLPGWADSLAAAGSYIGVRPGLRPEELAVANWGLAPTPVVEAHRGASADYPENTLCAFQAAIDVGARWIELDIHECASGELVVMHDKTVDRTTDGTGAIANLTLAQLRALDAGSWRGPQFVGERIPTLEEVLVLLQPFGTCLNVEVKRFAHARVARQLVDLLRAYAPEGGGAHLVSSFELDALLQVRGQDAGVPLAFLSSKARGVATAVANGFPWVHLYFGAVNSNTVTAAHAAGVRVMTWTMDEPSHFAHYAWLGVERVCTNRPASMLAARSAVQD